MAEPPRSGGVRRSRRHQRRCEIQLQNPCRYPEAGARRLRPWLSPLVEELAPAAGSFAVRFVSDREIRRLNARFRRRDRTTDVLSFPADLAAAAAGGEAVAPEPGDPGRSRFREPPHLGDVVISVPAARRQARRLGHGVGVELRVLLLHGVLHCLGYDHETDDGTMDRLERRLRRRFIDRSPGSEANRGIPRAPRGE